MSSEKRKQDEPQQETSTLAPGRNGVRSLPSVDRVLNHPVLAAVRSSVPHAVVVEAIRQVLAEARAGLRNSSANGHYGRSDLLDARSLAERAGIVARGMTAPSLNRVINATGVIIHTNLGRTPLSRSALDAIQRVAAYSNLEYDLEAGERGSRYTHAVSILRRVTGCEDGLVVNNNAAALVLVLAAVAARREAIVSRGQLVEIGGGFRIPDVMRQSGARLVEVGATNRTYIADYDQAITPDTAVLMRVHSSNFRIIGFTTSPSIEEIAALAHKHGLLVVDDLGSGALLDTSRYGLAPEPEVQASLKAGADLVLFSGDKLLGGPQCGVIVGKSQVLSLLRKHPLARALRVDKLTLAALEATLLHYLRGEAEQEVPVWRMIAYPVPALKEAAERWAAELSEAGLKCTVTQGESAIGGGSLPGETLPTWLVSVDPSSGEAGQVAHSLRTSSTPVIARVERDLLLLDPRTVQPGEEEALLRTVIEKSRG